MKLYIAAGQYVGTQAEAKDLERTFQPVDVPTDKDGLIGYLNRVTRPPMREYEPTWKTPEPAAAKPDQLARDISIEEAIGDADYARAIRLAEHIHCRLMEHARAGEAR